MRERGQPRTVTASCTRPPDHISGGKVPIFNRPKIGPWLKDPKLVALYDGVLFSKMDRATRARDWWVRTWAEENGKRLITRATLF